MELSACLRLRRKSGLSEWRATRWPCGTRATLSAPALRIAVCALGSDLLAISSRWDPAIERPAVGRGDGEQRDGIEREGDAGWDGRPPPDLERRRHDDDLSQFGPPLS
jgi:hypothetical protein